MKNKNKNLLLRMCALIVIASVLRLLLDWPIIALILLSLSIIWEIFSSKLRWKLFRSLTALSVLIPAYALLAIWEYLTVYR